MPSSLAIRATASAADASFIGSAICSRRIPLRARQRSDIRMTARGERSQDMNRMPVVISDSGVVGTTARIRRMRSHGSSRCQRTPTERWVEDVKSRAVKPARSRAGPTASTMPVVRPVAPQRLWLPSRVLVSTRRTRGRARWVVLGVGSGSTVVMPRVPPGSARGARRRRAAATRSPATTS